MVPAVLLKSTVAYFKPALQPCMFTEYTTHVFIVKVSKYHSLYVMYDSIPYLLLRQRWSCAV